MYKYFVAFHSATGVFGNRTIKTDTPISSIERIRGVEKEIAESLGDYDGNVSLTSITLLSSSGEGAELLEMKERGLLYELPCPLGTTVYSYYKSFVTDMESDDEIEMIDDMIYTKAFKIGTMGQYKKFWYLTLEEAKRSLYSSRHGV